MTSHSNHQRKSSDKETDTNIREKKRISKKNKGTDQMCMDTINQFNTVIDADEINRSAMFDSQDSNKFGTGNAHRFQPTQSIEKSRQFDKKMDQKRLSGIPSKDQTEKDPESYSLEEITIDNGEYNEITDKTPSSPTEEADGKISNDFERSRRTEYDETSSDASFLCAPENSSVTEEFEEISSDLSESYGLESFSITEGSEMDRTIVTARIEQSRSDDSEQDSSDHTSLITHAEFTEQSENRPNRNRARNQDERRRHMLNLLGIYRGRNERQINQQTNQRDSPNETTQSYRRVRRESISNMNQHIQSQTCPPRNHNATDDDSDIILCDEYNVSHEQHNRNFRSNNLSTDTGNGNSKQLSISNVHSVDTNKNYESDHESTLPTTEIHNVNTPILSDKEKKDRNRSKIQTLPRESFQQSNTVRNESMDRSERHRCNCVMSPRQCPRRMQNSSSERGCHRAGCRYFRLNTVLSREYDNYPVLEENEYTRIYLNTCKPYEERLGQSAIQGCPRNFGYSGYDPRFPDFVEVRNESGTFNGFEIVQSIPAIEHVRSERIPLLLSQKLKLLGERQVNDTCLICLGPVYLTYNLECKHNFHKNCLLRWLYTCNMCPYCKKPAVLGIFNGRNIYD